MAESFRAACRRIHREETTKQEALNRLDVRKKADREAIADALCAMAEQHGAAVSRREGGDYPGPRRIVLTFTLDGAEAHISLDGGSRLDSVALISWCARGGPGRCFSSNFNLCTRGGFNGSPHHKATSCPETVADLVNDLDGGLGSIAGGSAFVHYIHPWAAETAWIAAGSPVDRPKSQWLEEYSRTGVPPSESPAVKAARAAYEAAGGAANYQVANAAAALAYEQASC